MTKRFLMVVVGVVLLGGGAYGVAQWQNGGTGQVDLETVAVAAGDVRRIVSTSGRVRALVTVEVGSQLSGQVAELQADFNSQVRKGDVIARIDPKTYEARTTEAEAAVSVAEAGVAVQVATIERSRANLRQAEQTYRRIEALVGRGTASAAAFDDARATLDTARADLAVAEAQLANATATLRQRQAALQSARIDLERTHIRAPIDGVVIDRSVALGQTVAASLSAPTLFSIAQDLRRVQIDAQVDEADIGQVEEGQEVVFTVDAYPDGRFRGIVEQIRLAAIEEQSVVTYTVVIASDNADRRLLPGMTANVDIVTGERKEVLTVPNAALRFQPRGAAAALAQRDAGGGSRIMERLQRELAMSPDQVERARDAMRPLLAGSIEGGGLDASRLDRDLLQQHFRKAMAEVLTPEQMARYETVAAELAELRLGTVWVRAADGSIAPRRVRLGIADGQVTEVQDEALQAGDAVIVRARDRRG